MKILLTVAVIAGLACISDSQAEVKSGTYCSLDGKTSCTIQYTSEDGNTRISIDEENKENLEYIIYSCEGNVNEKWPFSEMGGGKIREARDNLLDVVPISDLESLLASGGIVGKVNSLRGWIFTISNEDIGVFTLEKGTTSDFNFVFLKEVGGPVLLGAREFCK